MMGTRQKVVHPTRPKQIFFSNLIITAVVDDATTQTTERFEGSKKGHLKVDTSALQVCMQIDYH